MTREGLVIGRIDEDRAISLQAISKCQSRVVQILRSDFYITDVKIAFDQFVIADLGPHLIEPHGEIDILHLAGQRVVQGLTEALGGIDVPLVSGPEEGSKEGNALNVIPMGMGNEDMPFYSRLAGLYERPSKIVETAAAVDDDEGVGGSYFDT